MGKWLEVLWTICTLVHRRGDPGTHGGEAVDIDWPDVPWMLAHSVTGANKLWLAHQLMRSSGHAAGLRFAEKHAHAAQRAGIDLLRANTQLQDDGQWLAHVNRYLASAGIAPVALDPAEDAAGSTSRFSRLYAVPPDIVNDPDMITVIMPAFNSEALIRHAARSILAQTWQNLELVIVDDCSTDGTLEAAYHLAADDGRVKVLKNAVNVGPYVSKNLALRVARGKYVTGQDADDWSHPERLQRDMQALRAGNGGTRAVLSMMLRMDEQGRFQVFSQKNLFPKDGMRRPASISLLIETECLRQSLGGWDSVRFSADSELIARADKILGAGLRRTDHVGMFCLDISSSLTNHAVHGVSKTRGISPVRKQFRQSYQAWHRAMGPRDAHMPFPHAPRRYPVPESMNVPLADVQRNIDAHDEQIRSSHAFRP